MQELLKLIIREYKRIAVNAGSRTRYLNMTDKLCKLETCKSLILFVTVASAAFRKLSFRRQSKVKQNLWAKIPDKY